MLNFSRVRHEIISDFDANINYLNRNNSTNRINFLRMIMMRTFRLMKKIKSLMSNLFIVIPTR